MKSIKKYNSFEELKSNDKSLIDVETSKKLHSEFEKAIKALLSNKNNSIDNKSVN